MNNLLGGAPRRLTLLSDGFGVSLPKRNFQPFSGFSYLPSPCHCHFLLAAAKKKDALPATHFCRRKTNNRLFCGGEKGGEGRGQAALAGASMPVALTGVAAYCNRHQW